MAGLEERQQRATMSRYRFRRMTENDARAIAGWRYPPPYDFYDLEPGEFEEMLDPASGCLAATDETGELAGFCCLGGGGRIPGAERAGLYRQAALDIGLGLRPDLTGGGRGAGFLNAVLTEARDRHAPERFRLAVAAFNARAIRVYEQAGFTRHGACTSPVNGIEVPFVVMTRSGNDNRNCSDSCNWRADSGAGIGSAAAMDAPLDLFRASRDELIGLVLAQRERIAELDRRLRWQADELAVQRAAVAELTARVGAALARAAPTDGADDPDAPATGGPRGMPGLKPGPSRRSRRPAPPDGGGPAPP